MSEFTFLSENQIFSDDKLDILKKTGNKCLITDFGILLGGYSKIDFINKVGKNNSVCCWWSKSTYVNNKVAGVDRYGSYGMANGFLRDVGARPAISYSSISSIASNVVRNKYGVLEVEYGEYPQTVVSKKISKKLESAFLKGAINQTGKSYTTDSISIFESIPFQARTHVEYEYEGKKYIRFVGDSNCNGKILSNGVVVREGMPYWVEVEPIKWLIDEKENIALSKKIIFSGVQFGRKCCYDGDLTLAFIKEFMDKYFSKDIVNDNLFYICKRINEIDDNVNIKNELKAFVYENIYSALFSDLDQVDQKRDSFISCMNIIFDSDTYYEMNSKLNLLKKAIFSYKNGNKKSAFELIKEIDSDKHKEVINGKIVSYPKNPINEFEKPKKIIDRMKILYLRRDSSFDAICLDSIHDEAASLKDLCDKINYYKLGKSVKGKVKSLFSK